MTYKEFSRGKFRFGFGIWYTICCGVFWVYGGFYLGYFVVGFVFRRMCVESMFRY